MYTSISFVSQYKTQADANETCFKTYGSSELLLLYNRDQTYHLTTGRHPRNIQQSIHPTNNETKFSSVYGMSSNSTTSCMVSSGFITSSTILDFVQLNRDRFELLYTTYYKFVHGTCTPHNISSELYDLSESSHLQSFQNQINFLFTDGNFYPLLYNNVSDWYRTHFPYARYAAKYVISQDLTLLCFHRTSNNYLYLRTCWNYGTFDIEQPLVYPFYTGIKYTQDNQLIIGTTTYTLDNPNLPQIIVPDNIPEREMCVVVSETGSWIVVDCDTKFMFICDKAISSLSPPPSAEPSFSPSPPPPSYPPVAPPQLYTGTILFDRIINDKVLPINDYHPSTDPNTCDFLFGQVINDQSDGVFDYDRNGNQSVKLLIRYGESFPKYCVYNRSGSFFRPGLQDRFPKYYRTQMYKSTVNATNLSVPYNVTRDYYCSNANPNECDPVSIEYRQSKSQTFKTVPILNPKPFWQVFSDLREHIQRNEQGQPRILTNELYGSDKLIIQATQSFIVSFKNTRITTVMNNTHYNYIPLADFYTVQQHEAYGVSNRLSTTLNMAYTDGLINDPNVPYPNSIYPNFDNIFVFENIHQCTSAFETDFKYYDLHQDGGIMPYVMNIFEKNTQCYRCRYNRKYTQIETSALEYIFDNFEFVDNFVSSDHSQILSFGLDQNQLTDRSFYYHYTESTANQNCIIMNRFLCQNHSLSSCVYVKLNSTCCQDILNPECIACSKGLNVQDLCTQRPDVHGCGKYNAIEHYFDTFMYNVNIYNNCSDVVSRKPFFHNSEDVTLLGKRVEYSQQNISQSEYFPFNEIMCFALISNKYVQIHQVTSNHCTHCAVSIEKTNISAINIVRKDMDLSIYRDNMCRSLIFTRSQQSYDVVLNTDSSLYTSKDGQTIDMCERCTFDFDKYCILTSSPVPPPPPIQPMSSPYTNLCDLGEEDTEGKRCDGSSYHLRFTTADRTNCSRSCTEELFRIKPNYLCCEHMSSTCTIRITNRLLMSTIDTSAATICDTFWDECGILNGPGIVPPFCDCVGHIDTGCGCGHTCYPPPLLVPRPPNTIPSPPSPSPTAFSPPPNHNFTYISLSVNGDFNNDCWAFSDFNRNLQFDSQTDDQPMNVTAETFNVFADTLIVSYAQPDNTCRFTNNNKEYILNSPLITQFKCLQNSPTVWSLPFQQPIYSCDTYAPYIMMSPLTTLAYFMSLRIGTSLTEETILPKLRLSIPTNLTIWTYDAYQVNDVSWLRRQYQIWAIVSYATQMFSNIHPSNAMPLHIPQPSPPPPSPFPPTNPLNAPPPLPPVPPDPPPTPEGETPIIIDDPDDMTSPPPINENIPPPIHDDIPPPINDNIPPPIINENNGRRLQSTSFENIAFLIYDVIAEYITTPISSLTTDFTDMNTINSILTMARNTANTTHQISNDAVRDFAKIVEEDILNNL